LGSRITDKSHDKKKGCHFLVSLFYVFLFAVVDIILKNSGKFEMKKRRFKQF